jgi:hypothetical protein
MTLQSSMRDPVSVVSSGTRDPGRVRRWSVKRDRGRVYLLHRIVHLFEKHKTSGLFCAIVTGLILALLCIPAAHGQARQAKPTEYEVKAAYLSNFGRFVEFPPGNDATGGGDPAEPFNICVLGADPFGPALDRALAGETINRSALAAKRISKVQDSAGCRILFIAASETGQLRSIVTGLGNASILTVGDDPQFTRRGGMIQFVFGDNRVRFEINLAAAQRAKLVLSSELVKLATAVRRTL